MKNFTESLGITSPEIFFNQDADFYIKETVDSGFGELSKDGALSVKTGKYTYDIEVALAGYSKKDIAVNFENSILSIKSVKDEQTKEVEENEGMLHKGIAKRFFSKTFTIADDVEVKGAELKDGLLKVRLEKIVPEGKKPRTIKIK